MTLNRLKRAKSLLGRSSVSRNAFWLTGILAVTVLTGFGSATQIRRVGVATPAEIERTPAATLIEKGHGLPGEPLPRRLNVASSFVGQNAAPSKSRTPKPKPEGDLTIIPNIDVDVSATHLWADGATPAIVTISLKAVRGNEAWSYTAPEDLVFHLEPRNASFSPKRVKIPRGAHTSEPASLIAKRPDKFEVTCTPERKYAGIAITTPQPKIIEFITPIDAIGIESGSASLQVNVAIPFEIFLYDKKDPARTRLRPRSPITVQVISESGNGNITAQPVHLTENEFSKFIHYVGTKTGAETIVANASYEGHQIKGITNRNIVFPLWIFLSGVFGSLLGAGVRYYKTIPSERSQADYLESVFYGVVVCVLVILYPPGTKLPQISNFIQPLVMFALGALVGVYGQPSVHWALSFIPKGAGQQNG